MSRTLPFAKSRTSESAALVSSARKCRRSSKRADVGKSTDTPTLPEKDLNVHHHCRGLLTTRAANASLYPLVPVTESTTMMHRFNCRTITVAVFVTYALVWLVWLRNRTDGSWIPATTYAAAAEDNLLDVKNATLGVGSPRDTMMTIRYPVNKCATRSPLTQSFSSRSFSPSALRSAPTSTMRSPWRHPIPAWKSIG